MQVFHINKALCRSCLHCLNHCPVHAIRLNDTVPVIDSTRCISCGSCVRVCSHAAVEQMNNLKTVRKLIEDKRKVIFSIDPACIPVLPEGVSLEKLATALQAYGAWEVADASEAAAAVAGEYANILRSRSPDNIILSACPVVRKLIERSYPELMSLLAPVASPMIVHGRILKRDFQSAAVVYVTTCPARIEEARDVRHSTEVNAVILLQELMDALKAEGIDPASCKEEPLLSDNCSFGALTAVSGGILECVKQLYPENGLVSIRTEEIEQIKVLLDDVAAGRIHGCMLELNACPGSCVGGFSESQRKNRYYNELRLRSFADADDEDPYYDTQGIVLSMPAIAASVDTYTPSEKEIENVLVRVGLANPEDRKNCGACGYATCQDRADAILRQKEIPVLCFPRAAEENLDLFRKVYHAVPEAIMLVNEAQEIINYNREAANLFGLKSDKDYFIFEFMDPADIQYVMDTGVAVQNRKIDIPEIFLRAEATLLPLHTENYMLAVFRDTSEEELNLEKRVRDGLQTVELAQKIIDKQMNVAQQIAFLLGETTAETKVTLNRIKDRILDLGDEA